MFRSDEELVDEGMYVASSTRAAGTSGTSDSDTSPVSMTAHVSGPCWPCVFYATARGCMKGDRCAYGHLIIQLLCWSDVSESELGTKSS